MFRVCASRTSYCTDRRNHFVVLATFSPAEAPEGNAAPSVPLIRGHRAHILVFVGYVARFANFENGVSKTWTLGNHERIDRPISKWESNPRWTKKKTNKKLICTSNSLLYSNERMKFSNRGAMKRITYTRVTTRVHRPHLKTGSIRVIRCQRS